LLEDAFSVSSLEVVVVRVAGFSNLEYRPTGCQPAMLQDRVIAAGADFSDRPFAIGESISLSWGWASAPPFLVSSRPFAVVF
jgi:hypothetical protein